MLNLGKETYTPQLKVMVAQIFAQGLLSCQIPFQCAQTIKCTVMSHYQNIERKHVKK